MEWRVKYVNKYVMTSNRHRLPTLSERAEMCSSDGDERGKERFLESDPEKNSALSLEPGRSHWIWPGQSVWSSTRPRDKGTKGIKPQHVRPGPRTNKMNRKARSRGNKMPRGKQDQELKQNTTIDWKRKPESSNENKWGLQGEGGGGGWRERDEGGEGANSWLQNRFPRYVDPRVGHFIPQLAFRWETGPCFQIKMATTLWNPAKWGHFDGW